MSPAIELEGFGGLITIVGTDQCLGDLFYAEGHGVFDPQHGRVSVPPEHVAAHNEALTTAMLAGLDGACAVGQGTYAYFDDATHEVRTFTGRVISTRVTVTGKIRRTCKFRRDDRVFRGVLCRDSNAFSFRAIR